MPSSHARFTLVLAAVHLSPLLIAVTADDAVLRAATNPPANQQESERRSGDAGRIYEIPDGGVEVLIAFVLLLRGEKTPDADYAKKIAAIVAAGRSIEEQAGDGDRRLDNYDEAIGIWLYTAVFEARTEVDRTRLLRAAQNHLASSSKVSRLAISAMMVMIEWYAKTPERASAVCREFVETLAESKDQQAASHVRKLEGTMRRLTLLGQTVKIAGTAMDGKPIDFAEMRGKVVLVDFWATWCGPCLAEVPNINRNFDLYHERGFEVISISMDEDRGALEKHLEEHPLPWITLHDPLSDEDHVARYYGITSLPTLILIDQKGEAASINARGPALGKMLAELLGPSTESELDP